MTTQSVSLSTASSHLLLRRALQIDGLFSMSGGLVAIVGAGTISAFMGLSNPIPLLIIGVGVFVYGLGVFREASRVAVSPRIAALGIVLNLVWVLTSLVLLIAAPFQLTTAGRWVILILAVLVGDFGIVEAIGLRRMDRT